MSSKVLADWVAQYTEEMYKWALYKTSSIEVAEDLVQDTFLAVSEKFSTFKGDSSPKTWLFSILNHKIIDYYRKRVNQPVRIETQVLAGIFNDNEGWKPEKQPREWHSEEVHLLDDEVFKAVLKKCLEALPEKWNLSVKMKYLTDKSGEEICQELGITPSNFWQMIHRAKLKLRDCIETNWFQN
ncbi:MAG: sigma-70 family RNA polymerase sigma factor [Bacteroidales bacterium]|nr:sigma-70 family RNA polymerase sigma factor [Bacteroidales bacterium]